MKLQGFMHEYGVYPEACASISLATDGYKAGSNVLMLALECFDGTEMSVFIEGGDVTSTQQYHGIPKKVYDDLAVKPQVAAEVLSSKLHEFGITKLVAHYTNRFVLPMLKDTKLVDNTISFIDIGLMHKALQFWTSNLSLAGNLLELQSKMESLRGKNNVSLDALVQYYEVKDREPPSPYIPVNKAHQIRSIFEMQLDTVLPF